MIDGGYEVCGSLFLCSVVAPGCLRRVDPARADSFSLVKGVWRG